MTEHAENAALLTAANQADGILAEGVRLIYARATRSYLLVPPVAGLLIWMESAAISRTRLFIWACVMAISMSIGLAFSVAFRRTQPAPDAAKSWLHRRIGASVVHGCAWGSSVLLIMPGQDRMELRVLTLAFLVGVTSTLVLTHVGARLAFPAVVLPLWLPAIIVMLTSSGGLSIGIGVTIIIYVGVMLHYNSELNRDLVAHVRTGVENAALARRLSGANEEAEAANQRLRTLNETVREMALRDELTGAHNRRHLMQELDREIARADRHGASLWVAVADLDEFKEVNDLHGHLAGDALLRAIAEAIETQVRTHDCFARYGGEEFAIVLPEIDQAGAIDCLERIRRSVEETTTICDGDRVGCTISIGATAHRAGRTASQLLSEADSAMYTAKSEGRNRVVLFPLAHDGRAVRPEA